MKVELSEVIYGEPVTARFYKVNINVCVVRVRFVTEVLDLFTEYQNRFQVVPCVFDNKIFPVFIFHPLFLL